MAQSSTTIYEPAATLEMHRPDQYKEIAAWLRTQAKAIVKNKGNYSPGAKLELQSKIMKEYLK